MRDIVGERTRPLVVVLGSQFVPDVPTWPALREALVEQVVRKAGSFERPDAVHKKMAAERILKEADLGRAFGSLRGVLGAGSFPGAVREAYAAAATVELPRIYKRLWSLPVRGMVSLSLDRLVTRAYLAQSRSDLPPHEYSGRRQIAQVSWGQRREFVVNFHGQFEDAASWTFEREHVDAALRDSRVQDFLKILVQANALLFVGVTDDDLQVCGLFDWLERKRLNVPGHYWLTPSRDVGTDDRGEKLNIKVIRYHSPGDVDEMIDALLEFVPRDDVDLPRVTLNRPSETPESLPPAEEMAAWGADEIRSVLNEHASRLLDPANPKGYDEYDDFSRRYDEAIYRAWYTSTTPPRNVLLGYTLREDVARGAFGRVFKAAAPDGQEVAVKVLLEEIRTKPDSLQGFRRGVRSMRILQQYHADGMVRFLEASEIPAFVAMEWIEGPNLAEATQSGYLTGWQQILEISVRLSEIIRRAHALPERVLHRDLRPANVMLRNFYADPDTVDVVVLDFDLSWHRGAVENSVMHSSAAGYLAPEQVVRIPNASTRNAAVDSFGLGMTLFSLVSGRDPVPGEHGHRDWPETVRIAAERLVDDVSWRSLPARFARVIDAATKTKQSSRWDMSQVHTELDRLLKALTAPSAVGDADLLAEEVASRSDALRSYEWDEDRTRVVVHRRTGMNLLLAGDQPAAKLVLTIEWSDTGTAERKSLGKYVLPAAKQAVDILKKGGWTSTARQQNISAHSVRIVAEFALGPAGNQPTALAATIDAVDRHFQFD
ncbi:protein kinase domain-containing protein [Spirilliplanes yamanashiensis]|uniref:protein kinase domain-containing protein n=1 Tax=Spirilliplanes yamanashiensis TaxID=42233 RepID=UPI0019515C1A|nr:protein kinase [Spirilliplanes yamanashiensis]MDP9816926.1 serine/threonine protein kinase [Spirilliplanes yamanashiensis]